jgi:ribonuclease G
LAEWFVERGIGEDRAILVERGELRAARLKRHGGLAAGLVAEARLISRTAGARRGTLLFESGEEALVDGLAKEAREGAMIRVTIVREGIAEKGRYKRAQARPTTAPLRPAPSLAEAVRASGLQVRELQRFPEDPWPEIVGEAHEGVVAFSGGSLTISPTPAMTLIDVDGTLPPLQLALAAVPAIATAVGRLDLAGSIGVDFPTLEGREDRRTLDEALTRALGHWPHQRTSINGFGFVQLVARLERPSILAQVHREPARAGALLLLRRAEDVQEAGPLLVTGHPRVLAAVEPAWREELVRKTGRHVTWQADPALAPLGGFAQAVSS